MFDLGIYNGNVYLDGKWTNTNIYIKDSRIDEITESVLESKEIYDAGGKKIIPGMIDGHVHFEMNGGEYRSADDFYTGSIAAAYGGITTIVDFLDEMPTVEGIKDNYKKRRTLAKKSIIDYGFHTSVCNMESSSKDIAEITKELGMSSIKVFTTYKEGGMYSDSESIKELLKRSSEKDVMIMVHSENDDLLRKGIKKIKDVSVSRPAISEITKVIELAAMTEYLDGFCYIVHISAGTTIKYLKEKFSSILNKSFFVESCPHYFIFDDSKYSYQNGYLYTMTPPLRKEEERKELIKNIDSVYTVGTDHCPFMSYEKEGKSLLDIPMGIGGIENSFSQMYTLFGDKIIDKFTINPAKAHGLYPKKGVIKPGSDADIVIFEDVKPYNKKEKHTASDYTLYEKLPVKIKINAVILRGNFVLKDGILKKYNGEYIQSKLKKC